MKTNEEKLVMLSLLGSIHHPSGGDYYVGHDGIGRILPGVGGITYNYKIGDTCMGIVGDHVEPCVSLKNTSEKANKALNSFSCVGNSAKVVSGDAKGAYGIVCGTHGGVEHVFIHFEDEVLEQLSPNDNILIKGYGQGLRLLDYPNIEVMNLDPKILNKMHIKEIDGKLWIGVTHIIPACLMGSGLGTSTLKNGDYDIMTHDITMNKTHHLDTLRFGDIVAIKDHYSPNGPYFLKDACSIGIIVHSDSYSAGHGPGVCLLLTAKDTSIVPFIDENANLENYL
ncbi:MAG: DUF4438 domain-containing protein [Breznakia sp.]